MADLADFTNDSESADLPAPPEWLDDEPEVIALLNAFVDKLDRKPASDRQRMPGIKLNKQFYPKLFRHDEAADRSWILMRSLEGLVFEIRLDRKRAAYDAEYVGASLRLGEGGEEICRAWLSRPKQKRYQEAWALAVATYAHAFADHGASLDVRPVKVAGKSADTVVCAFASIAGYANNRLTLRQLSAKCFWGHSKVLDAREDLVRQLYPALLIAPRPVLVNVRLPQKCVGVLFIENQDTYVQALEGIPAEVNNLALVYAAGFRGSAERIRAREGVSLHYHSSGCGVLKQSIEAWWFGDGDLRCPLWFWGDLDYSGMAILKVLRQRFGDIRAWPVGYRRLLQALDSGLGHAPDVADKADQSDPGHTGCTYADSELLPVIRRLGKFVDQEIA